MLLRKEIKKTNSDRHRLLLVCLYLHVKSPDVLSVQNNLIYLNKKHEKSL